MSIDLFSSCVPQATFIEVVHSLPQKEYSHLIARSTMTTSTIAKAHSTSPTSYQLQECSQDGSASEYVDLRPVAILMIKASCSRLRMVMFTGNGSLKVP